MLPVFLFLNRHIQCTPPHRYLASEALLSILLLLKGSRESFDLLAELIGVLLVLPRQFSVLLVTHLALVAWGRLDLLVGVQGVAGPLDLVVYLHDFVLDGGALGLVCFLVKGALVHLVIVVDYLIGGKWERG